MALVLQNVIVLSVGLADNVMLGSYSETSLSGAAAANQIQFFLQQIVCAVGDGLVVLGSQYWGQHRVEPIKKITSVAMKAGILFAVIMFILVSVFPRGAMLLFSTDEAVIAEGIRYLNIMRFSYVIFAITQVLLASLRSVETVKIAFYISIMSLIINCCINYLLIYGNFGFPEMGIVGAAIGTIVARCAEIVVVICYVSFKDKKLCLKISDFIKTDKLILKDYVKTALPIIAVGAMWGASVGQQSVILGHMEAEALTANSISSTVMQIIKTASVGSSSAAAIIIGKAVGAGNFGKIKDYTKTLQKMFIIIGIITSGILFGIKNPILSLYNLSDETMYLADRFLLVLCVTSIGTAYQMPTLTGIVKGGGDTKFVFYNDIVSIWCIVLPVSYLAAFVFNWSPLAVMICLNSDQIFKCGAAVIKVNRYKWVKSLTRAEGTV